MATLIQLRRDTSDNWSSNNPILSSGEIGIATDLQQFKIGNSASSWNQLEYLNSIPSQYLSLIAASANFLTKNDASSFYVPISASSNLVEDYLRADTASATYATSLTELNDVNVSSAIAGEFLKYDGSEWISASVAAGGGGGGSTVSFSTVSASVYTLQLSDVGKLLEFDSTASVTVRLPKDSETLIPTGSKINISKTALGAPINVFSLPDFVTWTTQNVNFGGPSYIHVYSVDYGNNTWVAIGDYGQISTSTDTITWTTRTSNFPFSSSGRIESVAYGNGVWVAGAVGSIATSTDAVTWTSQSSLSGNRVYAVAHGNGLWVIGGQSGQMRSSTDTVTWTTITSNFGSTPIIRIAYNNGIWIATGYSGTVRRSTDTVTWTTVTTNNSARYYGIAYGDGKWLLGGAHGSKFIESSTDGITWTTHASTPNVNIQSLVYGNGWWFAGTAGPGLFSTDSITWVTLTESPTNISRALTFKNNTLIGGGYSRLLQTGVVDLEPVKLGSPDSTYTITDRWSSAEIVKRGPNDWFISDKFESYVRASSASVTFLPRTTACATYLSIVNATASYSPRFISTNAQSGTSYTLAISDMNRLMEFSGTSASVFIPLGEVVNMPIGTKIDVLQTSASGQVNFYGSPPGAVWTSLVTDINFSSYNITGLNYGSGSYVAMSEWSPRAFISTDLTSWRFGGLATAGGSGEAYSLAYGNGRWVSGHRFGYIHTSTDAVTWASTVSNIPGGYGGYVRSIAYGNGSWVAVSTSHVRRSTDTLTWATVTSTGMSSTRGVAYGNGLWVVFAGISAHRSTDTITWTSVSSGAPSTIINVAYGNGRWVAGGYYGALVTSTDAITWTTRNSNFGNTRIISIAYGNGLWIAAGYGGSLRSSTDTITWTTQTPHSISSRNHSVGYQNQTWLNYGFYIGIGTSTQQLFGPVTLNSSGNKARLSGQWSAASLIKRANNTWVAIGDLSE